MIQPHFSSCFSLNLPRKLKHQDFFNFYFCFPTWNALFLDNQIPHYLTFFKSLFKYHCVIEVITNHANFTPTIPVFFSCFTYLFFYPKYCLYVLHYALFLFCFFNCLSHPTKKFLLEGRNFSFFFLIKEEEFLFTV